MKRTLVITIALLVSLFLMPLPVTGKNYFAGHSWRISEIFSNADGTIAFIELKEVFGGVGEYSVTTLDSLTSPVYTFPGFISCGGCSTSFANLLVATQGFADLPGAPPPDYILPDSFFSVVSDTLKYSIYHTLPIVSVPTNGVNSLVVDGVTPWLATSAAVNSPTNLNGDTATMNIRCKSADFDFSGGVNVTDLLRLLAEWGSCPPPCDMDVTFDGQVNVTDLLILLGEWGDCSPPP